MKAFFCFFQSSSILLSKLRNIEKWKEENGGNGGSKMGGWKWGGGGKREAERNNSFVIEVIFVFYTFVFKLYSH